MFTLDVINVEGLKRAAAEFQKGAPFHHCVVDDFWQGDLALALEKEIPEYDSPIWHEYNNPIELKKVCNNWNVFPAKTYAAFSLLNSNAFVDLLSETLGIAPLHCDFGLNGGGWHLHRPGGKLNTHLDYSVHPKIYRQRKLNIIIYMNSSWQDGWGGDLGLWAHDAERNQPGALVKKVTPRFNRAVLFDTTQNSWHGLPEPITSPDGQCRKSFAAYYLTEVPAGADERGKALFAPYGDQAKDETVLDLIKKRAQVETADSVYRS